MATEKMYEAAFQYKRTKLWKKMYDSELFAVRLSDGEIGYCCVMGLAGEHIALAVYVGDEGFQSFRDLAFRENIDFTEAGNFVGMQAAFQQSCLQCSFENREEIDEDDAEQVRLYARAHGMQLRGPHAFPNFTKYARWRLPWGIHAPEDAQRICEALTAATALAQLLEDRQKEDLGIFPVDEETDTLPLLIPDGPDGQGWRVSRTDVPEAWREVSCAPTETDPERVAAVRKLRKKGVYACELLRIPGMIDADPDAEEAPAFPALLLCVDTKSGFMVTTQPVMEYDESPEVLRDMFADTLISNKECPRAMKVRDEGVLILLEDLCMKAGILLSVDNDLPVLDEARDRILGALYASAPGFMDNDEDDEDDFDFFDDDEDDEDGPEEDMADMEEAISDAMEQLTRMSDGELRALPPAMVRQILEMAPFGFVPQELQLRLRRLFKKL